MVSLYDHFVFGAVCSHLNAEDVESLLQVDKTTKKAVLQLPKEVWLNVYATTYGLNPNELDPKYDWRRISYERYRRSFSMDPSLLFYIRSTIEDNAKSSIDVQHQLASSITSAYKHMKWVARCGAVLDVINSSVNWGEQDYYRELQAVQQLMNSFQLTNFPQRNDYRTEFVLYNPRGLPVNCIVKVELGYSMLCLKVTVGSVVVCFTYDYTKGMVLPENVLCISRLLLGENASQISHKALFHILISIGYFMKDEKYCDKGRSFVQNLREANFDTTQLPEYTFTPSKVPQWIWPITWRHMHHNTVPASDYTFSFTSKFWSERVVTQTDGKSETGEGGKLKEIRGNLEALRSQDASTPIPHNIKQIFATASAEGYSKAPTAANALSMAINYTPDILPIPYSLRLARQSFSYESNVLLWLDSKQDDSEKHLFRKLLGFQFLVPIYFRYHKKESTDFALSHVMVKPASTYIPVWLNYNNEDFYNRVHLEMRFGGVTIAKCERQDGDEKLPLTEFTQRGNQLYKDKMAYHFAMVKYTLFGDPRAAVSLLSLVEFVCIICLSGNGKWKQYSPEYFPIVLAGLIKKFAGSHSTAWNLSNTIVFPVEQSKLTTLLADQAEQMRDEAEAMWTKLNNSELQVTKSAPASISITQRSLYSKSFNLVECGSSRFCVQLCAYNFQHKREWIDFASWPPVVTSSSHFATPVVSSDGKLRATIQQFKGERTHLLFEAGNKIPKYTMKAHTWDKNERMVVLQERFAAGFDKFNLDCGGREYAADWTEFNHIDGYQECPYLIGFIDRRLFVGGGHINCYLQKSTSELLFEPTNLPPIRTIEIDDDACYATVVRLPYHPDKKYAKEAALLYDVAQRGGLFRYNRKTRSFEKIIFEGIDFEFSIAGKAFKGQFTYYDNGKRLFFVLRTRLYEAVWNTTKVCAHHFCSANIGQANTMNLVEHIPGIYTIREVMGAGSLGLVLTCTSPDGHRLLANAESTEICCVVYRLESNTLIDVPITFFGMCTSKPKAPTEQKTHKKHKTLRGDIVWSEKLKMLVAVQSVKITSDLCTICMQSNPTYQTKPTQAQVLKPYPDPYAEIECPIIATETAIYYCQNCKNANPNVALIKNSKYRPKEKNLRIGKFIFRGVKLTDIISLLPIHPIESKKVDMAKLAQDRKMRIPYPRPTVTEVEKNIFCSEERVQRKPMCCAVWESVPKASIPKRFLSPYTRVYSSPEDLVALFIEQRYDSDNVESATIHHFANYQKSDYVYCIPPNAIWSPSLLLRLSELVWLGVTG